MRFTELKDNARIFELMPSKFINNTLGNHNFGCGNYEG
jgi:hypothetical protein